MARLFVLMFVITTIPYGSNPLFGQKRYTPDIPLRVIDVVDTVFLYDPETFIQDQMYVSEYRDTLIWHSDHKVELRKQRRHYSSYIPTPMDLALFKPPGIVTDTMIVINPGFYEMQLILPWRNTRTSNTSRLEHHE